MSLSITVLYHYAECRVEFIVMPNVIMLSVSMLSLFLLFVVMLNVGAPS